MQWSTTGRTVSNVHSLALPGRAGVAEDVVGDPVDVRRVTR